MSPKAEPQYDKFKVMNNIANDSTDLIQILAMNILQ